jgi:hypothetical protein
MLKYREPPLTFEKTSRLITFLHHLLKVMPINSKNTATIFPLGTFIEDITPTLSTQQQSSWIIIIQFMLSCFRSCPQQYIYNSGVTTPILLIVVKQVLVELAKLPSQKMKPIEEKCFLVGKELLDLLLVRDTAITDEMLENSNTLTPSFIGVGTLSYYDVIYSVSVLRKSYPVKAYMPNLSFVLLVS